MCITYENEWDENDGNRGTEVIKGPPHAGSSKGPEQGEAMSGRGSTRRRSGAVQRIDA